MRKGLKNESAGSTYQSPHVDETEPLADVVAQYDQVRLEQSPVVGTVCIIELQAIWFIRQLNIENEWLINIPEQPDGAGSFSGAQSPIRRHAIILAVTPCVGTADSSGHTDERKDVFPHFSSPTSKILIASSSILNGP